MAAIGEFSSQQSKVPILHVKTQFCASHRLCRHCVSCVGGCAPAAGESLLDWLQPSASLWSREETPSGNNTKK